MLIIREENIWETWPNYKKSSLIHDYVTLYVDRNAKPHDYGNGEFYSAIEMHILEKYILIRALPSLRLQRPISEPKALFRRAFPSWKRKGSSRKLRRNFMESVFRFGQRPRESS